MRLKFAIAINCERKCGCVAWQNLNTNRKIKNVSKFFMCLLFYSAIVFIALLSGSLSKNVVPSKRIDFAMMFTSTPTAGTIQNEKIFHFIMFY